MTVRCNSRFQRPTISSSIESRRRSFGAIKLRGERKSAPRLVMSKGRNRCHLRSAISCAS